MTPEQLRNRLIELIKAADDLEVSNDYGSFADYLIENGVTVSPSKNITLGANPIQPAYGPTLDDILSSAYERAGEGKVYGYAKEI